MKEAHVYLFTDHSRQWWRFRIAWGPQDNRHPGILDGSGYRSFKEVKAEAILHVPYSYKPIFKSTKSVPHPEAVT